jgi:hypothetical protein
MNSRSTKFLRTTTSARAKLPSLHYFGAAYRDCGAFTKTAENCGATALIDFDSAPQ